MEISVIIIKYFLIRPELMLPNKPPYPVSNKEEAVSRRREADGENFTVAVGNRTS